MSKYLFLPFIISSNMLFSQSFKNDSIKIFIDKSIELIQSNSIHTENIDLIKEKLYNQSKDMGSLDEVAPLYQEVFKQLNDYHGNLKYKGKTYGWHTPSTFNNPYLEERLNSDKKVVVQVLNQSVGYIRIPGNNDFAFKKVDSIANDITKNINEINSDKIEAWIIDLRLNTGGNMYPILLGLKEFIGDNLIFGGFKNVKGESTGSWQIKEGKLLIDDILLERSTNLVHPIKKDIPVFILTSCYTASAGEMTAIAMIGRKNTVVIGEPTANYTTAVQGFLINDFAGINLSTDYVFDRDLKTYKGNIKPDTEVLGGDDLQNLAKDQKIIRALEYLLNYLKQKT